MLEETINKYKLYEYIRDSKKITEQMSNTKFLITKLSENDLETLNYCKKKIKEEKKEVEEALLGIHFHKNMSKREILINEISQYIYWQIVIAISKNVTCKEFNEEEKIKKIVDRINISNLDEKDPITVKEIVCYDLKQLTNKNYLKEVK